MGTQVEVEVDHPPVVVMEAPMVGMERMDPVAMVDLGQAKMCPSSPSPPGAWARVPGGDNILATTSTTEVEEEGCW